MRRKSRDVPEIPLKRDLDCFVEVCPAWGIFLNDHGAAGKLNAREK
jgi:hypothetical protein